MKRFELLLKEEQWDRLQSVAVRTGDSVAEHLRRLLDACIPLHGAYLSGAAVTGIEAHTTSGSVWFRGF